MMDKLGPYELNTIITGDARELARAIPDNSIDLVFCDPVYSNIDDYEWLARMASRILKPGGNLIAQSGHYYLPSIYNAMGEKGLDYVWTIAERHNLCGSIYQYRILARWKPYLWYAKGKNERIGDWVFDWLDNGNITKSHHAWEDCPILFVNLISRLTYTSSIVFDPFCGSGTVAAVCEQLKRKWLSFEIDPATAAQARQRVANTQPPLPMINEMLQLEIPV